MTIAINIYVQNDPEKHVLYEMLVTFIDLCDLTLTLTLLVWPSNS